MLLALLELPRRRARTEKLPQEISRRLPHPLPPLLLLYGLAPLWGLLAAACGALVAAQAAR